MRARPWVASHASCTSEPYCLAALQALLQLSVLLCITGFSVSFHTCWALSAVGIQTVLWTRFPPLLPSPFPVNVAVLFNSLHMACPCTNGAPLVPAADGIDQGYVVLNRPYGVLQWVQQQLPLLMEDYVFMLEPVSLTHIAVTPLLGVLDL